VRVIVRGHSLPAQERGLFGYIRGEIIMKKFKINGFYKDYKNQVYKVIGIGKDYVILKTEDARTITAIIKRNIKSELAISEYPNIRLYADNIKIESFNREKHYISNLGNIHKVVAVGDNVISVKTSSNNIFTYEKNFDANGELVILSGVEILRAVDYINY